MQRALRVDPVVLLRSHRSQLQQLALEVLRGASENEAEGDAAVSPVDGVMQAVRLVESPQISFIGIEAKIQAVVHKDIVGEEIDDAISRDAKGDEQRPGGTAELNAPRKQGDGDCCEEQPENVVQFPGAFAGLVMALVKHPEEAVHNILMQKPGHAFHCEKYGKK